MSWFFIALGAPFLWSLTNISDQYLVDKYSRGPRSSGGLVLFSSLIGIFTAVIIGFFTDGVFNITFEDALLLVVAGGLSIAWTTLYFFTLEIEDVSSVVPWFMTIPVFGYFFGYLFLNEVLSKQELLGGLIILTGVLIISLDFSKPKKKIRWRSFVYMTIACIMSALIGVIFKYVTVEGDFWVSSFWEYVGLGFSGILIYLLVPKYRREFNLMNQQGGPKIFTLNALSEVCTICANLLTHYAILLAPVTMVYLVGSFQPVIVLFLALVATKFFPKIVEENISKEVLVPKIIAIAVIILGSSILFL